ncbi:energy-coupling factor transporter transmembrane component T [Clostridium thermarum]|uniref:energy-coupling factor transporter transmembrane component T n=1 Tax=Clostridium thermarum TaxID=1716543 RepID=UPI001122C3E5|nr:energy-coupling factor transporter transmembrane component T [Clostridium thermarum]
MNNYSKDIHVLTALCFILLMIFIIFATDNPLILLSVFIFCVGIFYETANRTKFKAGLKYFLPFALVSIIINFVFNSNGSIVLFNINNRSFTLEALIYALVFSFKLLLILHVFSIIEIIVDNDAAVSYFSSKLPKATLLLMVSFKLFPTMKKRTASLKEVYSLRGVNYDKKSLKEQIKSYNPILAILLESSMEGAFDIGEAAYVRGFLSGKRTVYERQRFGKKDFILSFHILMLIVTFTIVKLKGVDNFDIYNNFSFGEIINFGVFIICFIVTAFIFTFSLNWNSKEIK